jgi:hypothetical protein
MGYRVTFGPDESVYDALKHSLVIDQSLDTFDTASVRVKHVTTIAGMMPVQISCNTTSSITFGGTVRGWSTSYSRRDQTVTYDIDLDGWEPWLNRFRQTITYNSMAINSIVSALALGYWAWSGIGGVHSMVSEAGSLTWDRVTVEYTGVETPTAVLDSLVAMQTAPDPDNPPAWRITPDQVLHLVGAVSSLGPTITVDDADLDLRALDVTELGTKGVTQLNIWGGYAQTVYTAVAGQNSISVYQHEVFWGPPNHWPVDGTNEVYLYHQGQYTPVVDVSSTDGVVLINSLCTLNTPHAQINNGSTIQAYVIHTAPSTSMAVTSAVTGEVYHFQESRNVYTEGWSLTPQEFVVNARSLLRLPTQEVTNLRVRTVNSQARPGGVLAVSLTVAPAAQGLYLIRRVRISDFGRGETQPPLYDIDAGALPRYRVDSLL